jgi:uncharacterized protein (TIGR00369 family)
VSETPAFMRALGIGVERADADGVVVGMDVPDTLMSPFGAVIGGAIATLFDTALAIAVARGLEPADRIATHGLTITFVEFAEEQRLVCRARLVSLRRQVAVAEGEVATDDGRLIAKAIGTFGVRRAAGRA